MKNHNIVYQVLDTAIENNLGSKVALKCISDDLRTESFTFSQLNSHTNKYANLLIKSGVKKGDHVIIFLPRTSDMVFAFLGTLKCGAVACPLFSAFADTALTDRLLDSRASTIITNKELFPKIKAVEDSIPSLKKIIIVDSSENPSDQYLTSQSLATSSPDFETVSLSKVDPAYMLYTSGSTGKPKGVIHKHESIDQQLASSREVFALSTNDILWCTADPGWITGIAYSLLSPLLNRTLSILYEGKFDPKLWYTIIQDEKVSVLYTAPTAIRMLKGDSESSWENYDFSSLRIIGSVGEPLNPEALVWAEKVFKTRVLDTWFQTELGAITIAMTENITERIGSMGKPLKTIQAKIINEDYDDVPIGQKGQLALRPSQTSLMTGIWQNREKYLSYFKKEWYLTGDEAWQDIDGYFWFSGRKDDIINTSGKRVGPFEIESELLKFPGILEAAVIGKPDDLRGEIIKAFIVLKKDLTPSEEMKGEIKQFMKKHLGGYLYPREIEFIERLPKTRSGKIMRRLLRSAELGLSKGDTSSIDD